MPHELRFIPRSALRNPRALNNMAIKAIDGAEFDTVAQLVEYNKLMGFVAPRGAPQTQAAGQRPAATQTRPLSLHIPRNAPAQAPPLLRATPPARRQSYRGSLSIKDYLLPKYIGNCLGGIDRYCPAVGEKIAIRELAKRKSFEKQAASFAERQAYLDSKGKGEKAKEPVGRLVNEDLLVAMGVPQEKFREIVGALAEEGLITLKTQNSRNGNILVAVVTGMLKANGSDADDDTVQENPDFIDLAAQIVAKFAPGFGCPARNNSRRQIKHLR